MSAPGGQAPAGQAKTDLLMRFFESDFFDSWICLTYLYKSSSQGVLDYLCNRLYTLPEKELERYLSQLCQLVYLRPGSSLERVLIDLCAQSLRIAVKTYWLLLAISQDQPRNKHIASVRDQCEQAALEGFWDLPFKETKLPPLSPLRGRFVMRTPSGRALMGSNGQLGLDRCVSPDPLARFDSRPMSPDPARPMSPDGLGGGMYSTVFMDQGMEGLLQPSPVNLRQMRHAVAALPTGESATPSGGSFTTPTRKLDADRMERLRLELGVGEGVTALLTRSATAGEGGRPGVVQSSDDLEVASPLFSPIASPPFSPPNSPPFSPPNSPRRRQTTFGATLDFIDALCTASSGLTAFQPEDRDWALRKVLQNINVQVEKASRAGVAIWFPMGDSNLRVVRLAPRESNLLNSREKAPFTLHVEVLDEEVKESMGVAASLEADAADLAGPSAVAAAAAAAAGEIERPCSPDSEALWREMHGGLLGFRTRPGQEPGAMAAAAAARLSEGTAEPLGLAAAPAAGLFHRDSARSLEEKGGAGGVQDSAAASPERAANGLSSKSQQQQQQQQEQPHSPEVEVLPPTDDAGTVGGGLVFESDVGCKPPTWLGAAAGALQRVGSMQSIVEVATHHARTNSQETSSSNGLASAALAAVKGSSAGPGEGLGDDSLPLRDCGAEGSSSAAYSMSSGSSGPSSLQEGEDCSPGAPRATPATSAAAAAAEGHEPLDPAMTAPMQQSSMKRQSTGGREAAQEGAAAAVAADEEEQQQQGRLSACSQAWSPPVSREEIPLRDGASQASPSLASPPWPRRLTDELDAASRGSHSRGPSLSSLGTPSLSPMLPGGVSSGASTSGGAPPMPHKVAGGGTWIGGAIKHGGAHHEPAAAPRRDSFTSGLSTALAGLRGEAPLVSVRLEVLHDKPLPSQPGSGRSSGSAAGGSDSPAAVQPPQRSGGSASIGSGSRDAADSMLSVGTAEASSNSSSAGPQWRRTSSSGEGGAAAAQQQCSKSGWACKLGLCKLCNTSKLLPPPGEGEVVQQQPYVKVHFVVQGGVDLRIKRTPPKHQRIPSHEAIAKVARQVKVPLPPNAYPPPLPPSSQQAQQQQQQPLAGGLETGTAGEFFLGGMEPAGLEQRQTAARGQPALAAAVGSGAAARPGSGGPLTPSRRPSSAGSLTPSRSSSAGRQLQRLSSEVQARQRAAEAVYGEKWAVKRARIQRETPHGRRPGWDLRCVIVKSGDDCRQELLAMQLIQAFNDIFQEAQLPLWLRPFEVLVTSNRTALIEMVPNAPSIHAIKAKSPPGTSLREHFAAKHVLGTPAFSKAQRNFVESLAAYSLVCYLLQIKDRHNGNILLDDEGHVIHIDFGFMLSNSPGGVNFEAAPFKLTREMLEVMDSNSDGRPSELFDYFKVLMIQGFLAVRKHSDRITLLVEMMVGSGCPCFKSKVAAVQGLKKRLSLNLPEHQVVETVLGLISDSLDSWRTRQYDYYQRILNGIL